MSVSLVQEQLLLENNSEMENCWWECRQEQSSKISLGIIGILA